MTERAKAIADLLPRYRYRFNTEVVLHEGISRALTNAGIAHKREHIAGPADRFDFLCSDTVIEAKIKGSLAAALRQVGRYCSREDVAAVVLVSTRSWRVASQLTIAGKPVYVVKIGAGL